MTYRWVAGAFPSLLAVSGELGGGGGDGLGVGALVAVGRAAPGRAVGWGDRHHTLTHTNRQMLGVGAY